MYLTAMKGMEENYAENTVLTFSVLFECSITIAKKHLLLEMKRFWLMDQKLGNDVLHHHSRKLGYGCP